MSGLLDKAMEKFRKEHGHDLQLNDLLFGNIAGDREIEKIMTSLLEQAGSDPAFIYAFKKTGRIVTAWNKDKLTDGELREWQRAVEGYRALKK